MNICFVTESLDEKHGYGRVSVDIIRELSTYGITGPILALKRSHIPDDLKKRTQAILNHSPLQPLSHPISLFSDFLKIRNAAKSCNGIHFLTESFLATTIFGYRSPYIVTAYGTWAINPLKSNFLSKMVFSRAYNNASRVITISNETKKRLNKFEIDSNVSTIHLGIDSKKWVYKGPMRNRSIENVLTVAALTSSKGLDIALKGVIEYSKQSPLHYCIVGGKGDKNYKEHLEELAQTNNYNYLTIRQAVDDGELLALYKQANVFILPSIEIDGDYEGFGLILLEAFAAGIPVIASRSGAIPEIIDQGESGLLVSQGSSEEIGKAIKLLDENPNLRMKCIENGMKKLEYFSLDRMVKEYKEVYDESFA